jgi:crotonobetainyl-CoA:carnitine CoA-transferase CaiB-like acyl-CoA transferase
VAGVDGLCADRPGQGRVPRQQRRPLPGGSRRAADRQSVARRHQCGLQTAIAILAALHRRETTETDQYIDVAMAATLKALKERADVRSERRRSWRRAGDPRRNRLPVLHRTGWEQFMVATSLVGSRIFPSYLRVMRRADLADDPCFSSKAAARKAHFAELHHIVQTWILTSATSALWTRGWTRPRLRSARCAHGRSSARRSGRSIGARSKKFWTATAERALCRAARGASPAINSSRASILPFRGEHNRAIFRKLGLAWWAVPRDRYRG